MRRKWYLLSGGIMIVLLILVYMVPQNVIGRRLNQVQILATTLMAVVCVIIALILIWRYRRRLDERLLDIKYREQLFGILANSLEDIFIMFSAEDYTVEYISPNIENILGIPLDDVKQDIRKLGERYIGLDQSTSGVSRDELNAIPLGGCWHYKTQIAHYKTNEMRWYSETLYRVSISNREKFVLRLSDRTLEEEKNQALEQALEIAESANKAKSNFLFNMSHDIRTPMNAIIGYALLLENNTHNPDKIQEYIHKITTSSQHLLGLINDVLDMSKMESGNTKLNVEEFRLSEVLDDLSAVILPRTRAKRQAFSVRVYAMKYDVLLGDRVRFLQILLNLVSNAVKYTPEEGKIELIIENLSQKSHKYARLRMQVRDNGIGMSDDFLKVVYEPFVRARNSTDSKISGTGLGMTITKNLVELMGGSIAAESTLGEGSVFTVNMTFRLQKQNQNKKFWSNHGITKILIVDDDEDVCQNICDLMGDTGVNMFYATDGDAAVQMIEDAHKAGEDFDIALLDWKMPEMNGIETASRIRACVGAERPSLILTSRDWSKIEESAREAGIDAFLMKPFFVSGLQQTIEEIRGIDPTEDSEEVMETAEQEITLKGLHFLIVEDNEINAELLAELLKIEGATSELAQNGRQAVEIFTQSKPGTFDMILMDIQMPIMNGYEATNAIRACHHPDAETIPIAALTANAFTEDIENALTAGMNAHISKPINMDVIRTTVYQLIQSAEV